jgi:hypothetical protein
MIRVIVNGVSFYTTKSAIKNRRVGDNTNLNEAIAQLYSNMFNAIGIGTTMHIYDSKMRKHTYDIQINV